MDLLTDEAQEIIAHQELIERFKKQVKNLLEHYSPVMNGEIYLSSEDVCQLLDIGKRTVQQYRDDNTLSYIRIRGKIIFRESDVIALLEKNYVSHGRDGR